MPILGIGNSPKNKLSQKIEKLINEVEESLIDILVLTGMKTTDADKLVKSRGDNSEADVETHISDLTRTRTYKEDVNAKLNVLDTENVSRSSDKLKKNCKKLMKHIFTIEDNTDNIFTLLAKGELNVQNKFIILLCIYNYPDINELNELFEKNPIEKYVEYFNTNSEDNDFEKKMYPFMLILVFISFNFPYWFFKNIICKLKDENAYKYLVEFLLSIFKSFADENEFNYIEFNDELDSPEDFAQSSIIIKYKDEKDYFDTIKENYNKLSKISFKGFVFIIYQLLYIYLINYFDFDKLREIINSKNFDKIDKKTNKIVFGDKKLTETITSDSLVEVKKKDNFIDLVPELLSQGRGLAAPPSRSSSVSSDDSTPPPPPPPPRSRNSSMSSDDSTPPPSSLTVVPKGTGGSFLTYQTR